VKKIKRSFLEKCNFVKNLASMNTPLSTTELLDNAAKLEARDFEQFVQNVLALRARRKGLGLEKNEAELLKKINQKSLSETQQKRFAYLTQSETRTESEQQELLVLVETIEQFDAERMELLADLARLRNVPVRTLMQQLGILPAQNG
jgi:DNA-directed RNA polymerase beta' subunit